MARPSKSFADLQREVIAAQMEQRRAAEQIAAADALRLVADDAACVRQPEPEQVDAVNG